MIEPASSDLIRQRRFGHYEILERLGAGGMGVVYRARDLSLGRRVAIKVLRGSATSDPERLVRFEQEARSVSALNHTNIVTIYEIGSVEGVRYIAMELVEGKTLRQILAEGPLVTRRALQLAAQAAGGIAQAHDAGIVHRDLKPENIMVTAEGRVKVLDFGLAKLVRTHADEDATTESFESPDTEPGRILGTVAYMSPEQAEGRPLDFRSDQFSCGAILYEMATGRPAFTRQSRAQTLAAILEEDPAPIAALNPAVPPPLRWIIERCLAKDPGDRYASTRDLARDLENVLVHLAEVSGPRPASVDRPASARATRWAIVGAVVVATAGGIAAWKAIEGRREEQRTRLAAETAATRGRPARRSVAVLGFRNLSGRADVAWLSTALAEMLTTELAAGGRLRTIPGENVGRMKMELSLSEAESLGRDTLARVGSNLGTDMVLLGSYLTLPEEQIRVDLRLQDVAAGETVTALAESGTQRGLVDLVTRTGARLRQTMGVEEPSAVEAHALAAGIPSNIEAHRLYAEGLAKLRVLDALAARDLLVKAVTADPKSPMVHGALADAWAMLGYDGKAREEAEQAYNLSGHLGREARLSLEARYREMAGEWDRAIEIYRALQAFFPDNLEHGLRLATAQSTGGKGAEALVTLQRLRDLPPPASQDPRIDLTEAAVAQTLGDFKRQQAAARRAALKGQAQGARLLVAAARHREGNALDRLGEVDKGSLAVEEARRIYDESGDRIGLARALNGIGSLAFDHGELEKAREAWEQALVIRQQIGNRWGVGASLANLGLVLWEQGELTASRRNLEQGLAIFRELGDQPAVASDLENLAGLLAELGDLAGATEMGEQARALARKIGDSNEDALSLSRLAVIKHAKGNLAGAEAANREVLSMVRETGTRDITGDALYQLGQVLRAKGALASARSAHERARQVRADIRAAFAVAKSEVALAELSIDEEQADRVPALIGPASAVFHRQKAADWTARAEAVLARSLFARGEPAEAHRAVQRASALAARSQSPHVRLAVIVTAARIDAAMGRMDEALRALESGRAEATRLGLAELQLELRLARAEIGLKSGTQGGRSDLVVLAQEAATRGFGLVSSKAEALLRRQPARRGGAS